MELIGSGLISTEEEEQMNSKGKVVPFSYSSNSSSPSSSSSHHHHHHYNNNNNKSHLNLIPLHQIYHDHHQLMDSNWLGTPATDTAANNKQQQPTSPSPRQVEELDTSSSSRFEDVIEEEGGVSAGGMAVEKEHMFDKVVTPSDVGKLNRLVIPKQHAEKYFPLDSSTNDKGLLLNFEDRTGKSWRFRYSYWNSSQSYVMTKGWSRFVKEKKLDAGDIVSFQRGVGDSGKDRFYIDWRRRPDAPDPTSINHHHHRYQQHFSSIPWSPLLMRRPPAVPQYPHLSNTSRNNLQYNYNIGYGYGYNNNINVGVNPAAGCSSSSSGTIVYMRSSATPQQVGMGMVQWQQGSGGGGGGVVEPMVYESVPVVQGKAAAKRLRLFGVNMDCPISDNSEDCDKMSTGSGTANYANANASVTQLSSSSTSTFQSQHHPHPLPPPLQLRLYNGTPIPSSSSSSTTQFLHNGKPSSMSLDLDI